MFMLRIISEWPTVYYRLREMISRHWKGTVKRGCADAYIAHLERETFPSLRRLPGFVEASILRRETEEGTEFQIVTVWQSFDAIQAFAGPDLTAAVVPDAAQRLMATYDRFVVHYEIVEERA
jgi:heme-degrading monooxygenase HmoA